MGFRRYKPSEIALAAPPMGDDEYQALVEDIKVHGLRNPIVIFNNRILDGVYRDRACEELGIPRRYTQWQPQVHGDSVDTPIAFAISQHTRRNLTVDQKAIYAAKLATLGRGRPEKNASTDALTQHHAALMLGISRASVQRARVVVDADIAPLTELVATRELSLGAAFKFAKLPPSEALRTTQEAKRDLARNGANAIRDHLETLDDERLVSLRLAATGQTSLLPPLTPEEQARQDAAADVIFRDHPIERAAAKFQSRLNHNMAIIRAHIGKINEMVKLLPNFDHEQTRTLGLAWLMAFEKVKQKLGAELTVDSQPLIDQVSI